MLLFDAIHANTRSDRKNSKITPHHFAQDRPFRTCATPTPSAPAEKQSENTEEDTRNKTAAVAAGPGAGAPESRSSWRRRRADKGPAHLARARQPRGQKKGGKCAHMSERTETHPRRYGRTSPWATCTPPGRPPGSRTTAFRLGGGLAGRRRIICEHERCGRACQSARDGLGQAREGCPYPENSCIPVPVCACISAMASAALW